MIKLKNNNKGFTLIEVLVCLGILGLLFAPIAFNLLTSIKATTKSKQLQTATLAAQSVLETYKSYGFDVMLYQYTKAGNGNPEKQAISGETYSTYEMKFFADKTGKVFFDEKQSTLSADQKYYELNIKIDPNLQINKAEIPKNYQIDQTRNIVVNGEPIGESLYEELKSLCLQKLDNVDWTKINNAHIDINDTFKFTKIKRTYKFEVTKQDDPIKKETKYKVISLVEYTMDYIIHSSSIVNKTNIQYKELLHQQEFVNIVPSIFLYNNMYNSTDKILSLAESASAVQNLISITTTGVDYPQKVRAYVIIPTKEVNATSMGATAKKNMYTSADSGMISSDAEVKKAYVSSGASYVDDPSVFIGAELGNTYYTIKVDVKEVFTGKQMLSLSNNIK